MASSWSAICASLLLLACFTMPDGAGQDQRTPSSTVALSNDRIRLPPPRVSAGEEGTSDAIRAAVKSQWGNRLPSGVGVPAFLWLVLDENNKTRYAAVGNLGIYPSPPAEGLQSPSLGPFMDVVESLRARFQVLRTHPAPPVLAHGIRIVRIGGERAYVVWARISYPPPARTQLP
jgi:hypothetical protein